jgi:quercetin dioxygenase-like cupin family protein
MRRFFAVATSLAAMASIAACSQEPQQEPQQSPQQVQPQEPQQVPQQVPQLAPEGRGLLPAPAEMPAALQGAPPPHLFEPDPSGGFSRTIFETDEDQNFNIIIRDFSFPPDKQAHTVTLPSAAFLHLLSGEGEVRIAKQRMELTLVARTAVLAGAPIEVVNNGEYPVVVRALIVEAK